VVSHANSAGPSGFGLNDDSAIAGIRVHSRSHLRRPQVVYDCPRPHALGDRPYVSAPPEAQGDPGRRRSI